MSALAQWSTIDPCNMSDVDLHIQQTNDRLQCIQQHLLSPNSYANAARELLEWCSDTRAFQWHFEKDLIGCLTVVSQVAGQFGYDLELGYRLLAVCAAHRDKLSPKSAGLLSVWCEESGRLLLRRHQKVESNSAATVSNSTTNNHGSNNNSSNGNLCSNASNGMQMPVMQNQVILSNSHPEMMHQWCSVPQPQKSLSVATTVWGNLTPGSQTSPYSNTRVPGVPYNKALYNSPMQPGYNVGSPQMQKPSYNNGTIVYNRQTAGTAYNQQNGFPSGSMGSRMNCTQGGLNTSPDTLSAAALAAATATATATATAAAICMEDGVQPKSNILSNRYAPQQYDRQYNLNPSNCYNSQHPGSQHGLQSQSMTGLQSQSMTGLQSQSMTGQTLGPMEAGVVPPMHCVYIPCGQMPMKAGSVAMQSGVYGPQRRPSPYPNPQQYMQSKRGPHPSGHQGATSETAFGMQSYGMGSQFGWNKSGYAHSPQPMPTPNYGSGQPNAPYCGTQSRFMQPGITGGGGPIQCRPNSLGCNTQFGNTQNYPQVSTMTSPVFDNLTPPLTPSGGNSAPPYVSPPIDSMPNSKSMMMMKSNSEDLRLTFPVRDGVILPSFRLEHNLAVSNHVFHLRDSVYQTLMYRTDLQLQLKCFHHEDNQMNTNWPASVTVSVNATPLTIERGDNKSIHRPLYLKEVCQPGRNTIQITVAACCCSHLFVLQLVHRPSVKSVLQGLLRKRLLPAEHCITKIKRNFSTQTVMPDSQTLREDGIEQTTIKVSLKCPITYQYIVLPVRGHDCKHIQCFDLESFLRLNCDRGSWRCPICNKPALLEGLEIDQFIWGILQALGGSMFEEVTVDTSASWKPIPVKTVKEEDKDQCIQRWRKSVSPSTMKLPTMNTWQESGVPGNQAQPAFYPISLQGQSFSYSPNGSQYNDTNFGPSPCFPPSSTPDFLSSLSQMGDTLLSSTRTGCGGSPGGNGVGGGRGGCNDKASIPMNQHVSRMNTPLMHPPTPLDGQGSLPRTPMNGQSGHPHTPLDVHGSYADGHPGTPLEGQQGSMKLRHGTPGTPSSSSAGNPHTPSSMPMSCGSVGPAMHNSFDSPIAGSHGGGVGAKASPPLSGSEFLTQSVNDDRDFSLGLNFDPTSMMDSDGQTQQVLDLLPDNIGDPTELLSYLGPMDNMCNGENNSLNCNDDFLSLFS